MKNKKTISLMFAMSMLLFGCSNKPSTEWVKEPFASYKKDPIALYDKGFIVDDGEYQGFMGVDGNLIVDMKYEFSTCYTKDAYGVNGEGINQITYLSQLLDVKGYDSGCWTGIVGPQDAYYYDTEEKVAKVITYLNEEGYQELRLDEVKINEYNRNIENNVRTMPVDLQYSLDQGYVDIKGNKGYILVVNGKLKTDVIYEDYRYKEGPITSLKKDGKWAIMDKDGKLLSDFIYDQAEVLNDDYVKVKKDKKIGLFSKDKKEYLYDDIENISAPAKGVVFAKQEGSWGLMKFNQ